MPNGERHSLARIPLRWMIRECFRVGTGIIFDVHMLKHQVGLDICSDPTFKTPEPLLSDAHYLTRPKSDDGISLWRTLASPFRWIRDKLSHTSTSESIFDQNRFVFKGESQEELKDALSPIYDQLEMHTYWKVMERVPCGFLPSPKPFVSIKTSFKVSSGRNAPNWME